MILEGQMPQDICYIDITQYGSARYTQRFDSFCFTRRLVCPQGSLNSSGARPEPERPSPRRGREARKIAARQGDLAQCADREPEKTAS